MVTQDLLDKHCAWYPPIVTFWLHYVIYDKSRVVMFLSLVTTTEHMEIQSISDDKISQDTDRYFNIT